MSAIQAGGLFNQLLVGGVTSLVNLAIHAWLMAAMGKTVHHLAEAAMTGHGLSHRVFVMGLSQRALILMAAGVLLVLGHFFEVLVWAFVYWLVQAAPPGTDMVYFAFGNYTTLGYGDVLAEPDWRLLGPITALNGILLIGWSTAVTLEVMRKTSDREKPR